LTRAAVVDCLTDGLRLPVIAAPMFLISGPELVIAAARAGIIGAFPAPNARSIGDLEAWLERIRTALEPAGRGGMWAINMIVHPTYERFDAELDLVCRYRPRLVITALGSPRRALERVHDYGGLVFADVISARQARKAADAGADGLVLVASGAGGHTGRYSAFAFVEEVRRFWSGPIVLGGAIGSGRGIRTALMLGADFAYVGTRFIASRESLVSDENRAMLVRSGMEDIIATAAVTGVTGNWLRESLEGAGFTGDALANTKKIDFSNLHGDTKAWKNIWGAGQGVGHTTAVQTVAEIVDELCDAYRAAAHEHPRLESWPDGVKDARAQRPRG
jgi:nitronate monooxygenase